VKLSPASLIIGPPLKLTEIIFFTLQL